MTSKPFAVRLEPLLREATAAYDLPGIGIAAASADGLQEHVLIGTDARGEHIDLQTLFPVASITKLATALAVLCLVDKAAIELDAPLSRYLPDAVAAREGLTVRRLLSHTSGLPFDLPDDAAPYRPGLGWPALARACLATAQERAPNTRVQYSNVGYGLLAIILERQTGQPYPQAVERLVLDPLEIEGYLGADPPRVPAALADVRSEHTGTELEPYNSSFWRSLGLPWGGLVTTVDGALGLVRAFLGHPRGFLSTNLLRDATINQTGHLSGGFVPPLIWERCPWGLGPELRDDKRPHWAPDTASPTSLGHSGASGCVAWADPPTGAAWVIVGTRTADNGWLVRRGPAIGEAILALLTPESAR